MTSSGTDAYTVANREDAIDFMADYPEYGEQRWYTKAIAAEQVSFSWRRMLPRTGGRGSYGHRHPGQEEVYFVISGSSRSRSTATFSRRGRRRRCGSAATRSARSITTPTTSPSC
jgi:hypothetical protein